MIHFGPAGWLYKDWEGIVYPSPKPKGFDPLAYLAGFFSTIEINSTYYSSQKPESFAKWHDETPDGFVFALKGPRFATNRRKLAEAETSL